jgi:hypothetical protein
MLKKKSPLAAEKAIYCTEEKEIGTVTSLVDNSPVDNSPVTDWRAVMISDPPQKRLGMRSS